MAATLKLPGLGAVTPGYLGAMLSVVFSLLAAAAFISLIFLGSGAATQRAVELSQYARILVKDGSIEGKLEAAPVEEKEPEAQQEPVAATPEGEEPPAPASAEPVPDAPIAQPESPPPAEASPPEAAPKEEQSAPAPEAPAAETPESNTETEPSTLRREANEEQPEAVKPATPPKITAPLELDTNEELIEVSENQQLPRVNDEGVAAWSYYGKPATAAPSAPLIAIVVTGLGLDANFTQRALELPEFVTLSFSPYAPRLAEQMLEARTFGHEVWIDLPMEPEDFPASDPGPLGLMKELPDPDNMARLHEILSRSNGAVGLIATPNEIFSGYKAMQVMTTEIEQRGMLLMLQSRKGNAGKHALYINRQLDRRAQDSSSLPQLLGELEAVAKSNGSAVGVLGNAPTLFSDIDAWIATLPEKKLRLQSLTAIRRRMKE